MLKKTFWQREKKQCWCLLVSDSLYFFSLFQTKKEQEEEDVDIATCSRGQYFGELALVTNKPRAASAYAVGSVKCLGTVCVYDHSCIQHANIPACNLPCYIYSPFLQSWTLKPSRGCWARAWTSWRETLLTMRSSWWPCLEVALRLSNKVHETAPMDLDSVDGKQKKKRLVRMFFPHNHFNSFSYKKCEYPLQTFVCQINETDHAWFPYETLLILAEFATVL